MPNDALTVTTVDFLRHGQAQGGDYFRGISDDPLTELGWQQMFQQCLGKQWQTIITSPLRRCSSFASAWSQEQRTELVVASDWREINFGDWEGLSAQQINQQQPDALSRYYVNPAEFTPPNAENYLDFAERIQQAWERLLMDFAGQNVLVVTHAGVIRLLCSVLLAIPSRHSMQIEIPHACITRFSCFEDAAGRFVQLNYHRPV